MSDHVNEMVSGSDDEVSRRHFIKQSGSITGTALAGSALAGSWVLGGNAQAEQSAAGVQSGSDELRIAIIGCGLRGTGAIDKFLGLPNRNIKLVAMGDAFEASLKRSLRQVNRKHESKVDVPEERQFVGLDAYKKVLETDCDLVILTTPPGFRPFHFEQAIKSGKHVFMEKPVAVDAPGVRRVLEFGKVAKEKNLAAGVGLQRRHDPKYIEAINHIHDGKMGDVLLSRVYWNSGGVWVRTRAQLARALGRAPSELEYQVNNWYYFTWLCGDNITEQHIHNIDVSNWVKQMVPVAANGQGGREVRTGKEFGQIFDHHMVEFTYPDGSTMLSQCRHQPECWVRVGEEFSGTKGRAKTGLGQECKVFVGDKQYAYEGPKLDPSVKTISDLVDSIYAGSPLNESEVGAMATMTTVLGRMATYSGKSITWEEAFNSDLELGPHDLASWDREAPFSPDADGAYPIPVPGKTVVL